MAERGRFELPIPFRVWPLSRRLVSTAHAPLRVVDWAENGPFGLYFDDIKLSWWLWLNSRPAKCSCRGSASRPKRRSLFLAMPVNQADDAHYKKEDVEPRGEIKAF